MAAESSAKAAARTAPSDLASIGSNPLNPKPTPPSSSPNSTAAPASSTSSMPAPITSAPACGRIINPIYGSVGLMWAGNWDRCQEAVEAVLRGSEIMQVNIEDGGGGSAAESHPIMPFKGCDIRHLSKESSGGVHRVRSRNRITGWAGAGGCETAESVGLERAPSHGSSSLETVEPALVNRDNPVSASIRTADRGSDDELLLDLTLGFNSVERPHVSTVDKHSVGDV
nr:LOB domain-containing protein 40-like [Ipomoea batatas]